MHVIITGINVSGRQIWEIEHCDVPKHIELVFDWNRPSCQWNATISKTTITKNA